MRRLGGNFTQPWEDPISQEMEYRVFVKWEFMGAYDSDAEATATLRQIVSAETTMIELGDLALSYQTEVEGVT